MILTLNEKLLKHRSRIENWKRQHLRRVRLPIYTSVDMRSAGYKIAPIDTNIYPAGFNNLCTTYNRECLISFRKFITENYGEIKKILVISEEHTRNLFYIENLRSLVSMLKDDGYEVRAGLVGGKLTSESVTLEGLEDSIEAYRIDREGDLLRAGDFTPDLVLSNNDFTDGVPKILDGVSQSIDPSPALGWHMRRKSDHFVIIEHMMEEFGELIGLDPWLLYPITRSVRGVDFHKKKGLEKIAAAIDNIIGQIHAKFEEHAIDEKPYVFVKSNYGTYGMGVMTASGGEEFLSIKSKDRKKMRRGKGAVEIGEVIVQEGIPTRDIHKDCPVEPVIYLVGGEPVGGFYRINCEKTIRENLNSRGMTFSKICFHQLDKEQHRFIEDAAGPEEVMMRVFGTIASVAAIATGYEFKILINE